MALIRKRKLECSRHAAQPALRRRMNVLASCPNVSGLIHTRQRTYLDPRVWSNLPEAIVDKIIAHLPLPSLFRFRCVCRRWDANLSCRNFLADRNKLQADQGLHYVMIVERKNRGRVGLAYNRNLSNWFSLPFSILNLPNAFDVVAAAGGLVCIKDKESGVLSVCNPMTQSAIKLPPLRSSKSAFEACMIMEENSREYRIIVWMDEPIPSTEVYCSRSQQWEMKASIDIRGDALSECGVVCGSTFYIIVINEYLSVFAYKITEDKWMELQAPMPPGILYSYLIDQWGTLLMVGAIGKDFPTKGICVWKLEKGGMVWEQVLRMPENLFNRLTRGFRPFDAFKCAGQGDQICFVADGLSQALMYDFSRKLWWWSPKIHWKGRYQIITSTLRLDAEV